MENFLNQAHQQGRKADMNIKSAKFEESLLCHRRAAELLLQAMQLSSCDRAKESIMLQHRFHLKQQDILQQQIIKLEKIQARKLHKKGEIYHQGTQTCNDTTTHLYTRYNISKQNTKLTDATINQESAQNLSDSLTGKRTFITTDNVQENIPGAHNMTVGYTCGSKQNVVKVPREHTDIIEELTLQLDERKKQISQLMKDLEAAKEENDYLVQKILNDNHKHGHMQTERMYDSTDKQEATDGEVKPNFELPPLEMPQFDFDSMQPTGGSIISNLEDNLFPDTLLQH